MDELRKAIDDGWKSLVVETKDETDTHFFLPNPFIAPSVDPTEDFVFKEQFYWDTYFTILPLVGTKHHMLAKGMVENLLFLQKKLGYVPNSSNKWHLGRSQPPYLSSMVRLIYEKDQDAGWLANAYRLLKDEYHNVWVNNEYPHIRKVDEVLSRHFHADNSHYGAEDESGWDKTTRFDDRALDVLPVDLNSLLYIYEKNMAFFAEMMKEDSQYYSDQAAKRKERIQQLMWHAEDRMFYGYDYVNQTSMRRASLAGFMPMFAEIASQDQAQALVENLEWFETDYGLTTTAKRDEPVDRKQWATPNGWAPLHFIVVEGLEKYGYFDEAKRIAQKWVETVLYIYERDNTIYEKYNVIERDAPPSRALYPDQKGFGWTNAVTQVFIDKYY